MKLLILVRHGHCEEEGPRPLTERGRQQIAATAGRIADHIAGKTSLVISSTHLRTRQSSEILCAALGAECRDYSELAACFGPRDLENTLQIVRAHQDEAEVLVLAVHYEHLEDFPEYFGRQFLGVNTIRKFRDPDHAAAIVIDCAANTCGYL